jgi:hypothetical protein
VSYIGRQPARGQNREIDDISGSFNGSLVTFNLRVSGTAVYPASTSQLVVSVGGVIQNPSVDYTVSGDQITFTTAPASSLDFFAIMQGDAVDINTPADGSVTEAKLASNFTGATGGAGNHVFLLNEQAVDTDYTIPTGKNAGSFGPCTVNSGVTVTIPSGSTWTVI